MEDMSKMHSTFVAWTCPTLYGITLTMISMIFPLTPIYLVGFSSTSSLDTCINICICIYVLMKIYKNTFIYRILIPDCIFMLFYLWEGTSRINWKSYWSSFHSSSSHSYSICLAAEHTSKLSEHSYHVIYSCESEVSNSTNVHDILFEKLYF